MQSLSQLLFASSAIGEPLGADQILAPVESGKIKEDRKVWEVANWMANEGTPAQSLGKASVLWQRNRDSVSRQHAYLNALLDCQKDSKNKSVR